jgi:integrase
MSTLRFNLREDKPDKSSKCPIELIYQVSGKRKYYQPENNKGKPIKLNSINWDATKQSAVYVTPSKAKKILPDVLHKDLENVILLETEIETVNYAISKLRNDIRAIEDRFAIDRVPYSASMVIDTLKRSQVDKTKKEEPRDLLINFVDQYISDHLASREAGYLTVFKSIKTHLVSYQNVNREIVKIENVDYSFFQRFQSFLINDGKLKNNTIAKALSTLKTLLAYANKTGIIVNDNYKGFSIKREKLEVIALNENEFATLFNMDLSKNKRLAQVRDIFCFACGSGLRISDMQQLKREHIKSDEIKITVKKTKTDLTIPLNAVTSVILDKYKDQHRPLPLISSQKLNTYIKELCMVAKIDEPIEIVRFRGSKRETTVHPKYELIHLHTGRKTFCTLSLERGMSAEEVMSISGHTDYKSFKRYINITEKRKKVVMIDKWGGIPILKKVV